MKVQVPYCRIKEAYEHIYYVLGNVMQDIAFFLPCAYCTKDKYGGWNCNYYIVDYTTVVCMGKKPIGEQLNAMVVEDYNYMFMNLPPFMKTQENAILFLKKIVEEHIYIKTYGKSKGDKRK